MQEGLKKKRKNFSLIGKFFGTQDLLVEKIFLLLDWIGRGPFYESYKGYKRPRGLKIDDLFGLSRGPLDGNGLI